MMNNYKEVMKIIIIKFYNKRNKQMHIKIQLSNLIKDEIKQSGLFIKINLR